MKKIITTVGTSIFKNYEETKDKGNGLNLDYLKKIFSENNEKRNDKIITNIKSWITDISDESKISAEIKSLIKLQKEKNESLEVYLITTDTLGSNLAAKLISDFFKDNDKIIIDKIIRIKDLQVKDFKRFEKGKDNLIKEISSLIKVFIKNIEKEKERRKELRKNVIFNITGGYKGIIPLMTILAQLYECEIFYIFEESDDIISIPRIPINFDSILTENLYIDLWFLKEDKDYNLQNQNKLKEYGFIRIIDKKNKQVTALGNVFYDMVHNHQAISKNVFGYFVEYKILEYLYLSGKGGFTHSYEEKKENSNENKRELDFAFSRKNGKLEVWEIKPATRMLAFSDKIKEQIKNQIKEYPNISKHRTIFYSINNLLRNNIKSQVSQMLNDLKSEFPNIAFDAEFLLLDGMKISKQNEKANPYQTLFKEPLKETNFIKLNSEENNAN